MDINELKGKTLDDATHAALVAHVGELIGQRDAARQESITHRKGLKSKVDDLTALNSKLFEKLGIESAEDLESLPDAKGQAEALKQFDAKVKRLERERDEAKTTAQQLAADRAKDRRAMAVAKAVAKHAFVDPDIATMLLEHGTRAEGDQLFFEAEGGKLVPLDEGAAWIAKSKPHLVKAQGGPGSGFRGNGGNGTGAKTMTRAEFESLDSTAKAAAMREKTTLTD